jgi:hypothetical protein
MALACIRPPEYSFAGPRQTQPDINKTTANEQKFSSRLSVEGLTRGAESFDAKDRGDQAAA